MELVAVLLHKKRHGKKEYEKRQYSDQHSDGEHYADHDLQQKRGGRPAFVAGHLERMAVEIVAYGHIAGAADVDDKARRTLRASTRPELSITPVHESLGHENGVEPVGETHDPGVHTFLPHAIVGGQHEAQGDAPEYRFRHLRESCRAGESEIIESEVVFGYDYRHHPVAGSETPVGSRTVDKPVGYRLEEHHSRHSAPSLSHGGPHPIVGRGEGPDPSCPGLRLDVGDLLRSETGVVLAPRIGRGHLLVDHKIVGAHETVIGRPEAAGILIELQTAYNDGQAYEI